MRVRNAHTSPIDGLAPGAIGEINATNPGVKALLQAGKLVPVEAPLDGMTRVEGRGPTFEEGLAMVAEIERQRARVAELTTENDGLRARVAELEVSGSKTVRESRKGESSPRAPTPPSAPTTPASG